VEFYLNVNSWRGASCGINNLNRNDINNRMPVPTAILILLNRYVGILPSVKIKGASGVIKIIKYEG